jgi:plastocyanin
MSIWGHRLPVKVIAIAAAVLVVGGLLTARSLVPAREIVLVARGMAFYVEGGSPDPNPTLVVKAGERVRVVLRNDDRGITHDFAVPVVDAGGDLVNWNEQSAVVFYAPQTPGRYEYVCRPHQLMMRGTLLVEQ